LKCDRSVGAAAIAAEVMDDCRSKTAQKTKTNKDGGEGAFSAFGNKHTNIFCFFFKKTDMMEALCLEPLLGFNSMVLVCRVCRFKAKHQLWPQYK
jgi:hypothetical protein